MVERRRLGVSGPALPAGEYVATVVSAETSTSAAGNPMVVWIFVIVGTTFEVKHWTVRRRVETGLLAQALGLGKQFRLSSAIGRSCRITVAHDGHYLKVTAVRPL